MSRLGNKAKREPREAPPSFQSSFGSSSLAKAQERIAFKASLAKDPDQ